jgi:dienelactone hydrolase
VLFVPENYTPQKKWPIVLFLHGAFERGDDGRKQVDVGLGPYVKARSKSFPFLVVFPQAKQRIGQAVKQTWSPASPDGRLALQILESVEKEFRVDHKRRILTGWSMGGYGVWQLAAADPRRWAALVPLSSGGDGSIANKLKDVPVWAFHGADDRIVPPDESRSLIAALKQAGGRPRYSEVADVGHYVFKVAYDNDELFRWMLNPEFSETSEQPLRAKPGLRPTPLAYDNAPFRPAVEIPRAVALRLGNDALRAVSYSVPTAMPPDMLRGRIHDIHDTTVASGRTFQVTFTGIRYRAKLSEARLQTTRRGRLRIQLGLEDLTLTIATAYVRGSGRSAVAGPISVVIGHRRPVWLTMEVEPYVEKKKLRLKLRSVQFQISDGNWHVSPPTRVSTHGLGMTRGRVSRGLVSGLYGSKRRIEREVRAVVPTMVEKIEDELDLRKLDDVVSAFWPLPVYKPRVRLFAENVSTDETGISISFGVTAAAIDPNHAPQTPRRVKSVGLPLEELPDSTDLRIHVAAETLQPLTDLLIRADVARIHVEDIPNKTFARFANWKTLAAAIPDLKQYPEETEIWSELILVKPLAVTDAGGDSASELQSPGLRFSIPTVIISTAIRTDPRSAAWTPYAEFKFSVTQQARVKLRTLGFRSRIFEMGWFGNPDIRVSARFVAGYSPKNSEFDLEKITTLFADSWRAWTNSGPAARRKVADIDFGQSRLRLSEVGWSAPHLFLGFAAPGIKISNSSGQPFEYETKGPRSGWSRGYTLPTGQSHEFDVPYAILYRYKVNGANKVFTLPVGTHSEFRVPVAGGSPQLFQARDDAPRAQSGSPAKQR